MGRTVRRLALGCGVGVLSVVGGLGALADPAAAATRAQPYQITFVARYCSQYSDVFANRARNNIMESLEDLGLDTQYANGELVSPTAEAKGLQGTNCKPLENWKFQLGTEYASKAVTGAWGALSKITKTLGNPLVTGASVPELDGNGDVVSGKTVQGAVTVTLTDEEAGLAPQKKLWVQGGVPDDPVLAKEYGGVATPEYGFASLRCATDALNGDNVEFIQFPAGVHHVFCYAFYVKPPPTSGTIIVKKVVTGGAGADSTAFPYNSDELYAPHAGDCTAAAGHTTCNISYNPDGFTLANGKSETFYRGAGQWTIVEGSVPDYERASIGCVSTGGTSTATTNLSSGVAQVDLAAGDTVTCTYTNHFDPPAGLSIMKKTTGGVGTFGFKVSSTSGGSSHELHATTAEEGVEVEASGSPLKLKSGEYEITETSPSSGAGKWTLASATCNGVTKTPPVKVTVTAGQAMVCSFTNHFTAAGSITLRKVTYGAVGSVGFVVSPEAEPLLQFEQEATTTVEGVAVTAHPVSGSSPTTSLALGKYTIIESEPVGPADGYWVLQSIECNGVVLPFEQGETTISLTAGEPHQNCLYTDEFIHGANPPIDPDITTDLKITKTASPKVVRRGKYVTYKLKVTNLGPGVADNVVVADHSQYSPYVIRIDNPTHRGCRIGRDIICDLGRLRAHHSVTITVVLSSYAWKGTVWNRAVVGSSTPETTLANNVAWASVRVIKTAVNLGELRG